ncbi:uncharacterized protein LOC112462305 [Temnothorax curvispinosus]|uniref:Uncharacterized protein LOC112462305 n=1 Tax=Temnothorax curvispinosus TaxID=300111 RepID=A0A6J1QMW2_9HYME|nr:uncharacterized protein LOC112462305 [Temnothorax curvispinosus]
MSSNSFVIITVYAMTCNVKGCGNYLAKIRKIEGNKIKYFSFPKDPALCNKWRQACGKENISPKYARICSKHFADEAFTKPLQEHLLGYSPTRTRKIHPDAIPTLHLHAVPPLTSNENVLAETMPLPVSNETCILNICIYCYLIFYLHLSSAYIVLYVVRHNIFLFCVSADNSFPIVFRPVLIKTNNSQNFNNK